MPDAFFGATAAVSASRPGPMRYLPDAHLVLSERPLRRQGHPGNQVRKPGLGDVRYAAHTSQPEWRLQPDCGMERSSPRCLCPSAAPSADRVVSAAGARHGGARRSAPTGPHPPPPPLPPMVPPSGGLAGIPDSFGVPKDVPTDRRTRPRPPCPIRLPEVVLPPPPGAAAPAAPVVRRTAPTTAGSAASAAPVVRRTAPTTTGRTAPTTAGSVRSRPGRASPIRLVPGALQGCTGARRGVHRDRRLRIRGVLRGHPDGPRCHLDPADDRPRRHPECLRHAGPRHRHVQVADPGVQRAVERFDPDLSRAGRRSLGPTPSGLTGRRCPPSPIRLRHKSRPTQPSRRPARQRS